MSFGGGFSGFGANNNNNTSTGFGASGFGGSTTGTGFGGSTSTGFGAQNNNTGGSSLFGGGANNNTGGGFGGFGANNNTASTTSPFGQAKPAFGATNASTGGSLFGSNTATSGGTGFGGFGNSANNAPTSTFGGGGGGGLFGQNQNKTGTGFGGTSTGGGGLFGGGAAANTATTGFGGSGATGTGFGANNNSTTTAFGASSQPTNQGTGVTPFSPFSEKDPTGNATSQYQSITFMQPYQPFSFEELRAADYNAGRKFGNSNGQAGAFGQSTGFGGFGQNTSSAPSTGFGAPATNNTGGGGLFGGGATNTAPAFGANNSQPTNTGFGGNSLFGQNKPASGGLFGGGAAAPSTGATGGGLFGSTANNTSNTGTAFGGFGQNATQNQGAPSGGLFGGGANNTQNKPAFGGFGGTTNTGSGFGASTGGFGTQANTNNNTTTGGGLFGNNTANNTSSPFGGNQQQNNNANTNTGGSLFGGGGGGGGAFGQNNQAQQNQNTTGGGLFGGGGFGNNANANNQPKPGGLFGGTAPGNTSGGLFGGQQNQQNNTSGGLFGNNNNNSQPASGGLFGAKPATSGGLFGGGSTNTGATGGNMFGGMNNNQAQQNTGTNAFGQPGAQQQKPPGLFGNSTNNTGGGSLFGLGNNQNQQQNAGTSSLFGNSQNPGQSTTNPFNQSQSVAATLLTNPYGNEQLFTDLGQPSPSVGPLATPLSGAQKPAKRPAALPQFKINPSASLRLITPQKRSNGYGFSYATYGTPGSAQSFTSNGLGSSLLQSGGLSRSLGKSFSTSNLRNGLTNGDSVLAPGAFTPNNRSYHAGSIRRLKVDKNVRTSLFGDSPADEHPPKRVSFESPDKGKALTNGTSAAESTPNNALVRTETDGSDPTPDHFSSSRNGGRASINGNLPNGTSPELDAVPEDEPAAQSKGASSVPKSTTDQEPGEYWMSPSYDEIRRMSREQLKKVSPFTVGRVGVGKIEFSEVDLTTVPLDDIMGGIVSLEVRKATVYENESVTPPMGKGLNVPSTITLENSWPRAQGGRLPVHERKGSRFDKHIIRLQRVQNTDFISYDPDTGIWIFSVQHFTTYGLDDEDEEDDAEYGSSMMSTSTNQEPTPKGNIPAVQEMSQVSSEDASVISDEDDSESNPDDTFDFKKGPSKLLPGSFGAQPIPNDDEMADDNDAQDQEDESFLERQGTSMLEDPFASSGGVNAPPVQAADVTMEVEEEDLSEQDMADSFSKSAAAPALYNNNDFGVSFGGSFMPKSILKASTMFNGTPKKDLTLAGDWAEQLQRTASPKKQDRQLLKERQSVMGAAPVDIAPPFAASVGAKNFSTTLDIMNSLWGPSASVSGNALKASTTGGKGFEWPYQKRPNTDDAFANMSETDQAFHASIKPHWTTNGTLVYGIAGNAPAVSGNMINSKKAIVSENKDVRFAQFSSPEDTLTTSLRLQLQHTPVANQAAGSSAISFAALAESVAHLNTAEARHERAVWKLASILFDPVESGCADVLKGIPPEQIVELESRIRRDALSIFWTDLVKEAAFQHAKDSAAAEEKAVALLSGNNIEDACAALLDGRDYRLATIVSQLPGDAKSKESMAKQIESWRSQNVLSEMTEPVRALYELTAGNVCVSEGKAGAAEDRASAFGISTRFGLDWRRSFGLRLWFTGAKDSLADAVQLYSEDIASGKENVRPVPYFTEQSLSPFWDDVDTQAREDTLFGLLKLYSRKPSSGEIQSLVTNLLAPTSVSGTPLNARLAWQLATLLRSKDILPEGDLTDATMDELSLAFSSQLETANELIFALNVLLHLSSGPARERCIRDLLYRRASALYDPNNTDALPTVLTQDFAIPESWLWHARALYARGMQDDHVAEVSYLLRAGDAPQAHTVLCRSVGPTAVIERTYDALRELLGAFHDLPSKTSLEGWRTGGQVYFDFIHLLDLVGRDDDHARESKKEILGRLSIALPGVLEGRAGKVGLEERVAVGEMAGLVKAEIEKVGREERGVDRGALDRLPVAGDGYARQGVDLSRAYYRAVVA